MKSNEFFQNIEYSYPPIISKDQMYQICHISKKTASYLLESGLVPSVDSGKKTRRYKIQIADVLAFLKNRDIYPESYSAPSGWYQSKQTKKNKQTFSILSPVLSRKMKGYYSEKLTTYPDVLNTQHLSEFTGYKHSTINKWCKNSKIQYFLIRSAYKIPKEFFIEFLLSTNFRGINQKSANHRKMLMELSSWTPANV